MQRLVQPAAVVTGQSEEEADEVASPFASFDRPVVVFVQGSASADDDTLQKIEEVVFKNEKVGLGMKAFRAVRMFPDDAANDPLIGGEGDDVPRLVFIDPVKQDIDVLESRKIKPSSTFTAMKRIARRTYEENLDKVVKKHIKLLNEQDKLTNDLKTLQDKESRLAEDGKKAESKLERVREEIEEVRQGLQELAEAQRKLWQLTRRDASA